MELVVDSNIVFSAMISDSATREILLDSDHKFYSPDFIKSEITKHQDLITKKSGLTDQEFEVLLNLILDEIKVQAIEDYEEAFEEGKEILGDQDMKDVPFISVAISKDCKIWSDDKDFQKQNKIEALSTEEIIEKY